MLEDADSPLYMLPQTYTAEDAQAYYDRLIGDLDTVEPAPRIDIYLERDTDDTVIITLQHTCGEQSRFSGTNDAYTAWQDICTIAAEYEKRGIRATGDLGTLDYNHSRPVQQDYRPVP